MLQKIRIVIVCLIAAGAFACSLLPGKTDEIVLAPTEVGTPDGSAVTKDIGPAGGTLASPDGRFTLTVPQNALTETTTFSIQPITNTLKTGLGLAYRLGPNGKTFTTPLELSLRYDEKDMDGSVPEALAVAFQDNGRNWHILTPKGFDPEKKRITVPITHFTDFSFLSRFRIQPTRATVHPGEGLTIQMVVDCPEQGLMDRMLGKAADCSSAAPSTANWRLSGPGAIEKLTSQVGVYYMAPAKKPTPNTATVSLTLEFSFYDLKSLQATRIEKLFAAQITIVDRGYRASGQNADMTYSGVICDVSKPFTISGKIAGSINYKFDFMPTSGAAGAFTMTGGGTLGAGVFTGQGSGTYTIEGLDTDNPRIETKGSGGGTGTAHGHTASGSKSGEGDFQLKPLENTECGGG